MINASDNLKKVYAKHHSFETFVSNIGADIDVQKARVLTELKRELGTLGAGDKKAIFEDILKELNLPPDKASFKITVHIADELSKIDDHNIGRYMFHRYRYDVYPKQKKLDKYPPYLQIEPTSICNYRCVFCYQSDKAFTQKTSGYMGMMTFDLFKKIIDQIEGNVDFMSFASRGEPLVCKDIDQMLGYCVGKFLGLKINTNASLLNEKHCHAILSGGVNTVVFSADAGEEPLYSQLRVGGTLENVLKKIEMFRKIKETDYSKNKIITRVSGVKVNDAQDIDSMVKTWGGLVDQLSFVKYNPWENVYEAAASGVQEPCSDLWRRMFVWYDGKVNPCDTDYKSTLTVGDFNNQNISALWLSEQYHQLREKHLKNLRSTAEPCRRCTVV